MMTDEKKYAVDELMRIAVRAADGLEQKAHLSWAIRLLDNEPTMELEAYLALSRTEWPQSPEYKQLQLDLAFATLDEMEDKIDAELPQSRGDYHDDEWHEDESYIQGWENEGGYHGNQMDEVRPEDEPRGQEDTEMGVDEHIRDNGVRD